MSGETWMDLAKEITGLESEEDLSAVLWACSSFPFGDEESVRKTLTDSCIGGGGTVAGAVAFAEAELDAAMSQLQP
ncbi:hypothetical protein ISN75_06770 [Dyella marensis]|uniref:hypothetical protein n=1 Tax=Dyella marensis TaxID=500610 RepID=UPI0031D66052